MKANKKPYKNMGQSDGGPPGASDTISQNFELPEICKQR